MANHHLSFPSFYEYSSEFSRTSADPCSSRGWTFESIVGPPVPESEGSNPESEDSRPGSDDCNSAFKLTSNIRAPGMMPQISQDSRYHSHEPISSIRKDRSIPDWDDGRSLDWGAAPEYLNSLKKTKKSTSPSTSLRTQLSNRRPSEWEAASTNHYDHGKYQEGRHATETITSSDRRTSSTSHKPKPYGCIFPECEAAFTRPYDLGRHQQSRHVNSKRFDCPVESCRRYGVPTVNNERGGFTRLDHFRDHLKNLHNRILVKDVGTVGRQFWVLDPREIDGELWMRDETGNIRVKDRQGRIRVKDAKTGLWR